MNPLVSIIIPTYNRAHLIGETLDSVLVQTYPNWECIIVDDGSSDNSEEVISVYLRKDNRFKYFKRPKERIKGPNACRNYGFEKSKGDYINWFDSDDLYLPNALEEIVSNFSDCADVLVCPLEKIYLDENSRSVVNKIVSSDLLLDYFVGNISFYVSGPFWKRTFLEEQGGVFDEHIRYLDDWDFNMRMLYEGPKIKYIDESLIQYCLRGNSLSREVFKLNYGEIKSEIFAREKQLKLLKKNGKVNRFHANEFVKNRYKYILRDLMAHRHPKRHYLLVLVLKKQFLVNDFSGIYKSILGFVTFNLFNKGYKLFK